jgi:hypothetical protein
MPISASITANSIDLESITTMSAVLNETTNVETCNTHLENEIVYDLATEYTVNDIHDETTANIYTSHSATQFYANKLDLDVRELFDIVLSPASNDGNFALSTQYVQSSDTPDSVSRPVGNSINKDISILDPTLSIYDSYLDISTNNNYGPFVDENSEYSCVFDASNPNNNILRALNSQFSTINNSAPLNVSEHTAFNTTYALATNLNKYFTLDLSSGEPIAHDLSLNNQSSNNGFTVNIYTEAVDNNTTYGTYRITQDEVIPKIELLKNEETIDSTISNNHYDITHIPFFNPNLGLDGSNTLIETNPSLQSYTSLFNGASEPWSLLSGFEYSISAVDVSNSGYTIRRNGDTTTQFNNDNNVNIFTLDNSNLTDNYRYMRDFARSAHQLSFNDVSVNIVAGVNGTSSNTESNVFAVSDELETLTESEWRNGEILLNINSPSTRSVELQNSGVDLSNILSSQIIYNDEGTAQGKIGISDSMKESPYVNFSTKLLMKSSDYDINYVKSNGASFNLFKNNSVVNSYFSPAQIAFNYNKTVSDNTVEIFKVNTNQLLKTESSNALYDNADGSVVSDYYVNGYLTNFTTMLNEQGKTMDKLKLDVKLKQLNTLGLYIDASNASWSTTNYVEDASGNRDLTNIVSSSNSSAYSIDTTMLEGFVPTTWPNLYPGTVYSNDEINEVNEMDLMCNGSPDKIFYTITLVPSAMFAGPPNITTRYDALIEWGKNASDSQNPEKPWQIKRPCDITSQVNTTTFEVIPSTTYTRKAAFNLGVAHNVELVKYTVSSEVSCNFTVGLLPYDNLTLNSPTFTVEYSYYVLQYTTVSSPSGTKFYNTIQLRNIQSNTTSINYALIDKYSNAESLSRMTFSGSLTSNDFKELNLKVLALNDDTTTTVLTNEHTASIFYPSTIVMELLSIYETTPTTTGDIVLYMGGGITKPLWSEAGFSVNFEVDPVANYTVDYFSVDIDSYESLFGNNTLSVSNGYSNIQNWSNNTHSVDVNISNGTTQLSIVNSSNTTVATITTSDYNFLNTQSFITYCNTDLWMVDTFIGASDENNIASTKILATNYTHGVNNNIFSIDDGIYIVGKTANLTSSSISTVGYVFEFSLLTDTIAVNMIGPVSTSLHAIESFNYQYIDNDIYSKTLQLAKYRGYHGASSVNQSYVINRPHLVATFSVDNETEVISQAFNVYNNTIATIDNLTNGNGSHGGIGLKIQFNVSALRSSDIRSFPVYAKGDDVLIKISNPNYGGFSEINLLKSLLDYDIYEFSGTSYNNTGYPVKIAPSRLKLKNAAFDYYKASYVIKLLESSANIRFVPNYLGDPNAYNGWEDASLLFSEPYSQWLLQNGGGYGYDTSRDSTLPIQFSRTQNVGNESSTSYIVFAPPYLHFKQTGNFIPETDLPYNPQTNAAVNNVNSYVPITSVNTYNPFLTHSHTLLDGNTATVSFNDEYVNNITFTHNSNKTPGEYVSNANNTTKYIQVDGNTYTIDLYLGKKTSNTSTYIATLFSDVATKLLLLPSTGTNGALTFTEAINNSSGVRVSFLQSIPGFVNSTLSLPELFADNDEIPNNINFEVGSFFLQLHEKLSLPVLNGISVDLYTRKLSADSSGNMFVNVYKYQPIANNSTAPSQNEKVATMFYNTRQVKRIPVPGLFSNNQVFPNWENALSSINYASVSDLSWENDTVFNSTNTTIFASVVNLKQTSALEVSPLLFAADTSGLKKATMVNKQPILKIINKVGMPLIEIDANGVIQAPILAASSVVLQPPSVSSINNSLNNYSLYSILKNTIDNVI